MWQEFRAFIARGNVIDLAVGIIIGAAFTSIVAWAKKSVADRFASTHTPQCRSLARSIVRGLAGEGSR